MEKRRVIRQARVTGGKDQTTDGSRVGWKLFVTYIASSYAAGPCWRIPRACIFASSGGVLAIFSAIVEFNGLNSVDVDFSENFAFKPIFNGLLLTT